MRKLTIGLIVAGVVFVAGLGLAPARAAAVQNDLCHKSDGFLGFPTWYEYLEVGPYNGDPCAITGPSDINPDGTKSFSFEKAIPRILLAIVDILLRVAGMVAVGYVIFGGFKYMTSQGDPDALKKAQGTVVGALIGLAIAIVSVTIVTFVGSKLWI